MTPGTPGVFQLKHGTVSWWVIAHDAVEARDAFLDVWRDEIGGDEIAEGELGTATRLPDDHELTIDGDKRTCRQWTELFLEGEAPFEVLGSSEW